MTAAEATLAKIRRLVPREWEERAATAKANTAALAQIRDVLYPAGEVRARIVTLVAERGELRMTEIRDRLQLTSGQASGHLSALVGRAGWPAAVAASTPSRTGEPGPAPGRAGTIRHPAGGGSGGLPHPQ